MYFNQLTDLPETEAKIKLEKVGLTPDILEKLFPSFPDTEVNKYAKPVFGRTWSSNGNLDRRSYELSGGKRSGNTGTILNNHNQKFLYWTNQLETWPITWGLFQTL